MTILWGPGNFWGVPVHFNYWNHYCNTVYMWVLNLRTVWNIVLMFSIYSHSQYNVKRLIVTDRFWIQEARLPQRNSASAAHMEGGARPSSPLAIRPLWLHLRVWSNPKATTYIRTSSVPSVKRTLRWIGHSWSFKVILIGAGRNPEWSVVVMCN